MDIGNIICDSWKCANNRGHIASGISDCRQFLQDRDGRYVIVVLIDINKICMISKVGR